MLLYADALARQRASGRLYPCYCTRAELSRLASAPQGRDDERRYPGTCRLLSAQERARQERAGRRPSWRFRVPERPITFHDAIAGDVIEHLTESTGDIVVRRSDGIVAYQLAVVVDDALMAITQVVRGADLLSSTARQLALYDALGYRRPAMFAHVPLATDSTGARLAKRDESAGVAGLRERGVGAEVVLGALAASCGMWPANVPVSLTELLAAFAPERIAPPPSSVTL
jgi:glutamyl-tRNA synthetase